MTVRGDSSFNMNPYIWTSGPETSDFFAKVANIDLTQVAMELEGYSVGGGTTTGAAKSYKEMVNNLSAEASSLILNGLSAYAVSLSFECIADFSYRIYHRKFV